MFFFFFGNKTQCLPIWKNGNEKQENERGALHNYLQFEIHGSAVHAFLTTGRGNFSHALPAGLSVPCQTHFNILNLWPGLPHGATHCNWGKIGFLRKGKYSAVRCPTNLLNSNGQLIY